MRDGAEGNIPPVGHYKGTRLLKTNEFESMQLRKQYVYKCLPWGTNIIHGMSSIGNAITSYNTR